MLDVGERWIKHEVAIMDSERQNDGPEITGKYMPAEWRSNKTWQKCPHSPWQTLVHPTFNPPACHLATSIPGSLIFNTTVASLKLGDEMVYAESGKDATARNVAIHDSNEGLVGWLHKMSLDWINSHQDNEKNI